MIKFVCVDRRELDTRSSGDRRKRVDAYFCMYRCPRDKWNNKPEDEGHIWICRFEVPRGEKFTPQDWPSKDEATKNKGWTL